MTKKRPKRDRPEQVTCSREAKAKLIKLSQERRQSFIAVVDWLLEKQEASLDKN